VKTSYRRWAPVYDRTFGAVTQAGRRAATARLNERLAETGGRVLEIGVGTGLALPLYRGGLRVTGIDASTEMLDRARRKVADEGLARVEALQEMDARALDLPDASFDAVAAMHVISVVPEPRRVMAEIARVLRPGGLLVVVNHFARAPGDRGVLARLERALAPFADRIGWHADFDRAEVLSEPGLEFVAERALPPLGMMTLMELVRR